MRRPLTSIFTAGRTDFSALPEFHASSGAGPGHETNLVADAGSVCDQHREDDVIKFVTRLSDGLEIESVVIPMTGRTTLCVPAKWDAGWDAGFARPAGWG